MLLPAMPPERTPRHCIAGEGRQSRGSSLSRARTEYPCDGPTPSRHRILRHRTRLHGLTSGTRFSASLAGVSHARCTNAVLMQPNVRKCIKFEKLHCERLYVLIFRGHSRCDELHRCGLSHVMSTPVCLTSMSIFQNGPFRPQSRWLATNQASACRTSLAATATRPVSGRWRRGPSRLD